MESAIRADDVAALTRVLGDEGSEAGSEARQRALHLAARQGAGAVFRHLIDADPALTSTFATQELLYAALDGASVSVWATILAHRPDAKNQRFGHHGTVVEKCVSDGHADLLEYLLQQGARVESDGRLILLRAQIFGASERVREILKKYGANENYEEDQ